ncbi:MAG: aminoacyl-tRNA hydrolase [Halanaerobiales bacterium]
MKLIVGLGNPGQKYAETRHNVGFTAIKRLADHFNIRNVDKDCEALVARGEIEHEKVILAQPLTYMNKSGRAISKLVDKFNISLENLIVIYDDLDLPTGKLRVKSKGSSGGHKGIKSIMENLDSKEINRIRIGIGRPLDLPVNEYVLREFSDEQQKRVEETFEIIDQVVIDIINNGVSSAMNKFN